MRRWRLHPDLTAARVNLALSMALAGEAQKAEGMLADATQAGTVTPRVRADFAVAQVMAGHPDQAEGYAASRSVRGRSEGLRGGDGRAAAAGGHEEVGSNTNGLKFLPVKGQGRALAFLTLTFVDAVTVGRVSANHQNDGRTGRCKTARRRLRTESLHPGCGLVWRPASSSRRPFSKAASALVPISHPGCACSVRFGPRAGP